MCARSLEAVSRSGLGRGNSGCIWCGEVGSTTEEDVIARWIARLFIERFWPLSPNFAIERLDGRWYDADEATPQPAKRVGILLPVCASCNNGWMSRLEEAARPTLSRLIFADHVTVTRGELDVLAAWAFKTLVNAVFESHRRAAVLVPAELREHLREGGSPPPDVLLEAFLVDGRDTQVRTRTKAIAVRKPGGRLVDNAVVSTALIGRLALRMVSFGGGGGPQPKRRLEAETPRAILWPVAARTTCAGRTTLAWPPSASVSGEVGFEMIAHPDDAHVRVWLAEAGSLKRKR